MIENRKDDILEKLVHINRITKVVKGGRRFGFSALVVVGNQNGKIGIAHAKAKQVPDAIKKANEIAKRNIIKISLKNGRTLHHDVLSKSGAEGQSRTDTGHRHRFLSLVRAILVSRMIVLTNEWVRRFCP